MADPHRLGGPGYALVKKVQTTMERHRMVQPGDTVVVGVSGGADSTCLLDVLARGGPELTIHVAHVDHGLSATSAERARDVSTAAASAGFDVHVVRAPEDLAGPNLQARARDFRLAFLGAIAEQVGAARVATGHTLDDRVETTLARLVHGAGTRGLAGIRPVEGARIRPLLDVRRGETRAYCTERGLSFHDDPANEDPRFERTTIRHEIVTAIERRWGDGAVRSIAIASERLREDADALEALTDRLFADLARGTDPVAFDLAALHAIPSALRRRLLERAVGRVRDRSGGIDAAVEALEHPSDHPRSFSVATGTRIDVGREEVTVRRVSGEVAEDGLPASEPNP